MSEILLEAAKQIPAMVVLVVVVWMFLDFLNKLIEKWNKNANEVEAKRAEHEKSLEEARQKYNADINILWASHIKTIVEGQEKLAKTIAEALSGHEKASQERYEKMGITKDLLTRERERSSERRR